MKILNNNNVLTSGSTGYRDLSNGTVFEVADKGCISVTSSDSGYRSKLNKELYLALGTPETVEVVLGKDYVAKKAVAL